MDGAPCSQVLSDVLPEGIEDLQGDFGFFLFAVEGVQDLLLLIHALADVSFYVDQIALVVHVFDMGLQLIVSLLLIEPVERFQFNLVTIEVPK